MKDLILRLIDITRKVTKWLVIIAAAGIGVMAIINFVDIVLAKFFHTSVPGALDTTEEVMVLVALFPVAYIWLERGHIYVLVVRNIMHPVLRIAFEIFQYVLAALICGFITVRTFAQFQTTLSKMILKEGTDLPIWPANLATTIAFGFITFVWVLFFARTLVAGVKR
jgi:TRAP-type C4-dicarboxylate transport system permease small subunit